MRPADKKVRSRMGGPTAAGTALFGPWAKMVSSPNIDERQAFWRIANNGRRDPTVKERYISVPDAHYALAAINSPTFRSYPDASKLPFHGYRDGWGYDILLEGRGMPPACIEGLVWLFPRGEEPECERFIAWTIKQFKWCADAGAILP